MILFLESHPLAKEILYEILGVTGFEAALVVLRTPWYGNQKPKAKDFFWGATGEFRNFIDRLRSAALAPIRNSERLEVDIRGRNQPIERLYLYLQDLRHLEMIRQPYETTKLIFNYFEGTYLSDLLDRIEIHCRLRSGELVQLSQLSEGQQQLLTVIGLMMFSHQDEALYLLDEPESHLNPHWSYDYLSLLGRALNPDQAMDKEASPLSESDDPRSDGRSQVILATRNPLVVGSLPRNQVRVIKQDPEGTFADEPEMDLEGLGVDGILQSEIFDHTPVLPRQVLRKIRERDRLFAKKKRSASEESKLKNLSEDLSELGITRSFREPLSEYEAGRGRNIPSGTLEDRQRSNEEADKILSKLMESDERK